MKKKNYKENICEQEKDEVVKKSPVKEMYDPFSPTDLDVNEYNTSQPEKPITTPLESQRSDNNNNTTIIIPSNTSPSIISNNNTKEPKDEPYDPMETTM